MSEYDNTDRKQLVAFRNEARKNKAIKEAKEAEERAREAAIPPAVKA